MLGTLLLTGCAVCCQVDQAPREDRAPQVRRLVRQLDAVEKDLREQAEKQLLDFGPDVLDFLPRVSNRMSAEVKQRLNRIRTTLERERAEATVKASLITLSVKSTPVSEVLKAIQQQSGNQITDYRDRFNEETPDPEISVSFDKTPFWEALDEVLDLANLKVYPYGEQGIAFQARTAMDAPRRGTAAYRDAFRFEGLEIISQRNLRGSTGDRLQLVFEAAWEPRLAPVVISHRSSSVTALDDNMNPIEIEGAEQEMEFQIQPGMSTIEVPLSFTLPPRDVKRLSVVRGTLSMLIPGRVETFVFEDIEQARQIEQTKAGATVTLDRVRRNIDVWEVRVLVRFDKASRGLESHRGWVENNEAFLIGPDKTKILEETRELVRETDTEVGMAYLFDLPEGPQGHTLVYKTPVAILDFLVEYELKDMELP